MNKLNKHQEEAIRKASITPQQILENIDGLNEEIEESWNQELAKEEAEKDKTLKIPEKPIQMKDMNKPMEITKMDLFEPLENDLEAEAKAAEELLRKQREAAKAKAAEKQSESTEEEEEKLDPEERQRKAIMDLLGKVKGAPNEQQIARLKEQYGKNGVHVLALGEDDVYIFTYLRRGQWQQIQKVVQAAANSDVNQNPDELLKEKVIQYTVLWPKGVSSPEFLYNSRAGIVDTLYQSILLNSYFLSPQQSMMLTAQL